jgi:hypothetical protein
MIKQAKVKVTKDSKSKVVAKTRGNWPQDPRNPWTRDGSSYRIAFNIIAAHPDGLSRSKLVELLTAATGKDLVHAGYDAQVILTAQPNGDGTSNNDSPRHRSCKPGFFVVRQNDHYTLMVD